MDRTVGELHIQGPRGFVLDSFIEGSPLLGVVVGPGETVNLNLLLMTLGGPVSIDGQSFQMNPVVGPVVGVTSVFGSVVAPPFESGNPISIFAPFSFEAQINPDNPASPVPPFPLDFVGQGTVQVDFVLNPFIPFWEPNLGVFRFQTANEAPIPEPATLFLVGSGIAGLVAKGRRRSLTSSGSRRSRPSQ